MSFFTGDYRDIHTGSQLFVTNQPQANLNLGSLDFKQSIPIHEKGLDALLEDGHHYHCEHGQTSSFSEHHHNCHNIRVLLPTIFALVALGGILAWNFVNWHGLPAREVDLMGRALGNRSESALISDNQSQLASLTHDLLIYDLIISAISIVSVVRFAVAGGVLTFVTILCIGAFIFQKRAARRRENK
jgi:hypothetical protein